MLADKVAALLAEAKRMTSVAGSSPKWVDLVQRLVAALEEQDRFLSQEISQWAEDDTEIKELCRPFGIDVDGDSFGVPTMVDCVEQLAVKLRATQVVLLQTQKNASRMDA